MDKIKLSKTGIMDSYENLLSRAKLDIGFVLLTIGASAICTFGFRMNSSAVIVGAMVISPLLYSVVSAGVTSYRRDWSNFLIGMKTLIIGLVVAIVVATVINLFFPTNEQISEIVGRLSDSSMDYFFVALFSGLSGTFAFFWPDVIEAIAGIAISVALIPPVVLMGIGLGNFDNNLILSSGLIIVLNIIGIYIGSFLMFAILMRLYKNK